MNWTAPWHQMGRSTRKARCGRRAFLVLLLSALFFFPPRPVPASFLPDISPEEALKIAGRHVEENQIDLSRQYIYLLRLDYDPGVKRRGFYWRVHWKWSVPRMGGEYGLRIYMDRTVLPEISGP